MNTAITALKRAGFSKDAIRALLGQSSHRDDLAKAAMKALLSRSFGETGWGQPSHIINFNTGERVADRLAIEAYIMADAMLKARTLPNEDIAPTE